MIEIEREKKMNKREIKKILRNKAKAISNVMKSKGFNKEIWTYDITEWGDGDYQITYFHNEFDFKNKLRYGLVLSCRYIPDLIHPVLKMKKSKK